MSMFIVVVPPPPYRGMTELYDPQLCYILDGFLLLYGLIITGMYIREKFFKSQAKPEDDAIYSDLKKDAERGIARRGVDIDDTYQPLTARPTGDTYKELPVKKERRRKRDEQVYQDLNSATKDTYDSLQMQPLTLPPR
ncbi:LOW QUALITY PROTEIN: T-cell surface glycoprotein CD3 zeta chain-like [Osmerus mordax]|uniref:LOW QUALITY PROTEIN: T-cell surface glycoprotein CD3 zeta chain-like n=1 Tax=Osmerus mordax TaxID=8014 RepID=UPI003510BE53